RTTAFLLLHRCSVAAFPHPPRWCRFTVAAFPDYGRFCVAAVRPRCGPGRPAARRREPGVRERTGLELGCAGSRPAALVGSPPAGALQPFCVPVAPVLRRSRVPVLAGFALFRRICRSTVSGVLWFLSSGVPGFLSSCVSGFRCSCVPGLPLFLGLCVAGLPCSRPDLLPVFALLQCF